MGQYQDRSPRKVIVQELVLSTRIGHVAAEREATQPVAIDLSLDVNWSASAHSKNLDETVCYATLCSEIRKLVETREWVLVEELSESVQSLIFSRFPAVTGSKLRVKKFALPGTDWVAVESDLARKTTP